MIQLLPAPLTLSIPRPDNSSMNLESRRARRAFTAFGIAWNVALPLLVLFSSWPFLAKAGYLLYGAWGVVNLTALWSGKADPPGLRAWQYVAFFVASGLMFLGVFVFRS
jgi:hypothetical protein